MCHDNMAGAEAEPPAGLNNSGTICGGVKPWVKPYTAIDLI